MNTTKFSTIAWKLDKDNLDLVEKLYDNCKLQGLSEIELLLKTLYDDESIVANIEIKNAFNNERDQDEFIALKTTSIGNVVNYDKIGQSSKSTVEQS
ncbi:19850_t:CDS:2 [Racocetra fulgida]|uniref:19850_t:CDS:1 n=1 Tax=Racocetra fulgida TaxID=60492 RepID=A0A9N8VME3_9GLOM|nr:19850_t:CDS:2 [Racocetra fulgida]